MGAYENPAEIEGQFDLTQQSRAYQNMLNTVTKATIATINKVDEEHKLNAEKNKKIITEAEEKGGQLQVILDKGRSKARPGMNYDCYQPAVKEYIDIQKKVGLGTATPEDKRRSAQIIGSISNFSDAAGDLNEQITTYSKALKYVPMSEGSINIQASNPTYIAALNAVMNNDGETLQPSFAKDSEGRYDYTQNGYNVKIKEGDKYKEEFVSAANLSKALDGNMPNGIVYNKTYTSKIDKVKTLAPYIFEQKDGVPTSNILPDYLDGNSRIVEQVGSGTQGGIYRQVFNPVDLKKINVDRTLNTNIATLNASSYQTQNEAASLYYNQVLPTIDRNINNKEYNEQEPYLKYQRIPAMSEKNYYNQAILSDDTQVIDGLQHNMKAAVLNSFPKKQAVGEKYFVSKEEIELERRLNEIVNGGKPSKKGTKDYRAIIENEFAKAQKISGDTPVNEVNWSMMVPEGDQTINKNFVVKKDKEGKYTLQIIP